MDLTPYPDSNTANTMSFSDVEVSVDVEPIADSSDQLMASQQETVITQQEEEVSTQSAEDVIEEQEVPP